MNPQEIDEVCEIIANRYESMDFVEEGLMHILNSDINYLIDFIMLQKGSIADLSKEIRRLEQALAEDNGE